MASTKFLSNLVIDGSGGTVLDVQGSVGQLLSITDSLTGDLFAVSDISGVPILNVNSSGAVDIDGTLNLGDSDKIQLGASQDLQIYHDGSHSYISDNGTGELRFIANGATRFKIGSDIASFSGTDFAIAAGRKLYLDGQSNTYITESSSDTIKIFTGGSEVLQLANNAATFAGDVNMASAKIESDGTAAAGAYLELHHNNNDTTDVCATINLTNNAGGYASIIGGTTGANNTGYIEFKTDNAGTQGTVLTLNGDNSATFAGAVTTGGKLYIGTTSATTTATTALLLGAAGEVKKRALGSNAFSSTSFAPLASPALTGTPTAPTAGATVNTTQLATTAFVQTAVSNLVDSSPDALNTLNELAAALGNDASFSTTVTNSIATKLPLAGGTMTGALTITHTGDGLTLQSATDGTTSAGITFTSQGTSASQKGHVRYNHRDGLSYGSAESFTIGGTEATTTILADGKLMYAEGIYSKPSSGTGGGTRRDANWNTAYTYSQVGHLPLAGGTMTGTLTGTYGIFGNSLYVNQGANLTSQALQVNGFIDITDVTSTALRWYNGSTFRGGLGTNAWAMSGSDSDLSMYVSGDNSFFVQTNNVTRAEFDSDGLEVTGNVTVSGGDIRKGSAGFITIGDDSKVVSIGQTNEMNFMTDVDSDQTMYLNHRGYNNASTRFRSLEIRNGKGASIVNFNGSNKNATFSGTIGATNFSGSSSGTNTGDQVLPTLSSLGALSTTGKAADSELLDGINSTSFLRSDAADTASELITFSKGISSDGNSKFYNWRALDNSASASGYFKIARITGGQSSRFMITLAGRSTSYSDEVLPAMGHIVGQLNNDNNYDVVFYNHSTASSEVVTEVGIVDINDTDVDLYIKTGTFAEITASGHISDGTFVFVSNTSSDGVDEEPTNYAAVTEYTAYNSGNLTPLAIGTTATTALAGNTSLFDGAYGSLTGRPTLGTAAAAATGDFATAAQGTKADAALPKAGGTMTGNVILNDSVELRLGSSSDFKGYHNGTNTHLRNYTGQFVIENYSDDKDILFKSDDGSGGTTDYIVIDGSTTENVFYKNAALRDSVKATFGNSNDLQIYHDGSNSYINDAGTGDLYIRANNLRLQNADGSGQTINTNNGGNVELFHNNSKKFETTSTGVSVTGNLVASNDITATGDLSVRNINASGDINVNTNSLIKYEENTDVDTGTETVATVAHATYTAAFFDYVIKNGTNVRAGTVYSCHDGTNVEFTETSTVDLGDTSDVTLAVDISGTDMRLRATTTSNDWSVKSLVRAI